MGRDHREDEKATAKTGTDKEQADVMEEIETEDLTVDGICGVY